VVLFLWLIGGDFGYELKERSMRQGTPHLVIDAAHADPTRQVPLPMDSGDVLLFSSRLFHLTPNRSDHRRPTLQIH